MRILPQLIKKTAQRKPAAQVAPPADEKKAPADQVDLQPKKPGLLDKAVGAVTKPIVGLVKRTVGDTVAMTAAAGAISALTLGALAVAGPVGLLVPVGIGVATGVASQKIAKQVYKTSKEARFEGAANGAALASYGLTGAIGATTVTGLTAVAAAGTAAGFLGGVALAAGTGALYGVVNSLYTQALEAGGVINKRPQ